MGFAHLSEMPMLSRPLRADVPAAFEGAIMVALAKEPSPRPRSAAELRAAMTASAKP